MIRCVVGLSVIAFTLLDAAAQDAVEIGSRRELFVEESLVERLEGDAELRLHHPVPQEVVMEHDEPWEGSGSVYHSVFKDGDLYRMYYAAGQLTVTPNGVDAGTHGQFCCYAESDDGIHWRKPALGLHEFEGSRANNIVMVRQKVGDAMSVPGEPAVFKDDNPDAPADARYKALLPADRLPEDNRRGLLAFKSPDGLHWSPMSDEAVINAGAFDSQNLAFWDAERGQYRAYWRYFTGGGDDLKEVWNPQGDRAIRTAVSHDFLHWEEQADLEYVDSPSEQLYTNQVKPYYRAPHLLIGFPTRYVERGHQDGPDHEARASAGPERTDLWSPSLRALPELENRLWRAKASERYGRALTEGLLMASRDGVVFKRWNEGFLRPGIERPGTWNYGHQFIAWHPVETKGMLEGGPNELSLYAVESYWTDTSDLLRRYTLRLDGFVSVQAPLSGGELVTQPIVFSGNTLWLNFATSAAGSVRVEIQNEQGEPLPGYSLEDCEELFGDTLDRPVVWKSEADLAELAGRAVRVRFELRDADLYSYQFRD
ncbi:MAG: hypothetical protein DWQ45_15885 [Planctomycetota bacterium]|nr:MAG: hypothetical protein DWQ29_07035 [Planctomycetota bacterium]REK30703.1 MAG: hypothetical protein DWQ41_01780 [Planctomycetota bacterium]REK33078.1 MAG: hypothetical protein DWQ45_15885 [Planctomycetota bacterium]